MALMVFGKAKDRPKTDAGPTVDYCLSPSKTKVPGENGSQIIYSTFNAPFETSLIAKEITDAAMLNPKVKKCLAHFWVSVAKDEHLTDDQWMQVSKRFGEILGFDLFVAARHVDLDHDHMHICALRIRLDGTACSSSHDYYKLRSICHEFEDAWGLKKTGYRSNAPRISRQSIEAAKRDYVTGKSPTPIPAKLQLKAVVSAAYKQTSSFAEMIDSLEKQGVEGWARRRKGKLCGLTFSNGKAAIPMRECGHPLESIKYAIPDEIIDRLEAQRLAAKTSTTTRHGQNERTAHGSGVAGMDETDE